MLTALYNTTDKLQLTTTTTADLEVIATYTDMVKSTGLWSKTDRQLTKITSIDTTDILSAPAGTEVRGINSLFVRNKHASSSNDVTVVYDANATDYEIYKTTLLAGEALEYIEGIGFFKLANTAALDRKLIVAADVTNTTTSFADITGLTCNLLSGKHYNFMAMLIHRTDATTNGARFGINIGAVPTNMALHGYAQITSSVTAATWGASAMVTARDTAMVVETTGPGATNMIAMMYGWIQPSADGTFAVRSQSENGGAGALIIEAGSWCRIWEATG